MNFIEIKMFKFETLVKRKDIVCPQWFAVPIDILEHPDFFDIDGNEFKVFIFVCGLAAKLNAHTLRIYPDVVARRLNIPVNCVEVTIEKLSRKRWDVMDALRECYVGRDVSITLQDKTRQDKTKQDTTEQDKTHIGFASGFEKPAAMHRLVDIWNQHRGKLSLVKKSSRARDQKIRRIFPTLTETEWTSAVIKISASDFCNGSGSWVATFDWLIKPDTALKVLEGKYDNREKPATKANQIAAGYFDWAASKGVTIE